MVILEQAAKSKMLEFTGPDFNHNGYCNAKYRMSFDKMGLGNIEVPERIEALNERGEWQQHPVIFIHYGSHGARKNGDGLLIIFLPEGKYTSRQYNSLSDWNLYKEAEKKWLTKGNRVFVRSTIKEEE